MLPTALIDSRKFRNVRDGFDALKIALGKILPGEIVAGWRVLGSGCLVLLARSANEETKQHNARNCSHLRDTSPAIKVSIRARL